MGDIFSSLPVLQFSAGSLVTLIVLMILTDRLVTRQRLVDKQAECDRWHEAADKWQQVSVKQGMTLERILTNVELTTHAIVDIRELALRNDQERDQ